MVPKLQVANACFSCSPPDLNSSKLSSLAVEASKIIIIIAFQNCTHSEIKIPLPLCKATASNHPNIFIFTVLLSVGRAGEA
jgi:hypothetical protein